MRDDTPESGAFFFPATCHPPLVSRRQVLAAGAAALAAVSAPARAFAGDDGAAIIRRYAGAPSDPWAVCHGVRGMGKDFKLVDGRRAVDWLLETQLVAAPIPGGSALAFPLSAEAHPNMFLKTMLEAGVPLDYGFTHQGQRRAVKDVVDGARALLRPAEVIREPNMLPWTIIALTRTTSPVRGRWNNAWGEPVDLEAMVDSALVLMEDASQPLMQAMREDRPETGRAPVHGFTCGGAHMLYALLVAAHTGHAGSERAERIRQQAELMLWRLHADMGLIDRFYKDRSAQAGAGWYEMDAKVKLLGHGEECLAFGTLRGVVKLSAAQQARRRAAVNTLRRLLDDMEGKNVVEARDIDGELFRQLIGDTCHARRGLTLA